MELDVTRFFYEAPHMDYSASRAEIGDDAGPTTWRHALDDADDYSILPDDRAREAFRDHVRGFGAWDDEEIAAWSDTELNALCMQMVAGDIREYEGIMESDEWDWEEYYKLAEQGQISARLSDGSDGKVYYYLGD